MLNTGIDGSAGYLQSFDKSATPYPNEYLIKSQFDAKNDARFYIHVLNNNGDAHPYPASIDHAYYSDNAGRADSAKQADSVYGDKVKIFTDNEGGNIEITAPDGTIWQIDAYNGNLRIYRAKDNQLTFPITLDNNGIYQEYKYTHRFGNWKMYADSDTAFVLFPLNINQGFGFGVFNDIWTFCPFSPGGSALGGPNHRWGQPWFTTSPNIASDRNLKKDVYPVSDKYLDFFALLRPVSYRLVDGTSGRIHIGFIAQEVEKAMKKVGLTDLEFAGFCKDKIGDVYTYSLRYEEFIALNAATIQRQQTKIDSLEQHIEQLEQRLERLEKG